MKRLVATLGFTLLAACSSEPGPTTPGETGTDGDAVKQQAKSIEEAADKAVKLIEEDTSAEINASMDEEKGEAVVN